MALDELATDLRINVCETALNNLEVMATLRVADAEQIIRNAAGYLGHGPKRGHMKGGYLYADIEATQHQLKLYEPANSLLRLEIHASRMAYLGVNRPNVLADLAQPQFVQSMATKLVDAIEKVVWNCADLDPNTLPDAEGYLLARGRNPAYWQINRQNYNRTEYDRLRKQRERERPDFDAIVQRHWIAKETPAELNRKVRQQLTAYADMMHTSLYGRMLLTYLKRWQIVANLPTWGALPKLPKVGPVSQIYTSFTLH